MCNVRILHCGESIENYYLCLQYKIGGFTIRFNSGGVGDIVYIAVKIGKVSVCGARCTLGMVTDFKPNFQDIDRYIRFYRLENVEYCQPFNLRILKKAHDRWGAKYLLSYKPIDKEAINIINIEFNRQKIDEIDLSLINYLKNEENKNSFNSIFEDDDLIEAQVTENEEVFQDEDEKYIISSCYQTVRFKNETDINKGLEAIVTTHFYDLFEYYNLENSILIPKNRLFLSKGLKSDSNRTIPGISSIPDALLITFDEKSSRLPLKINLIEYECYGELKTTTIQKNKYFDGVITPQLMRFANVFGISTDSSIRVETIDDWINKILRFIEDNESLSNLKDQWIKHLNPLIKDTGIDRAFEKELRSAFKLNIRIILIIDEITSNQKSRLDTMMNSVKLEPSLMKPKDNYINFDCYVVKLQQSIRMCNLEAEYALTLQQY